MQRKNTLDGFFPAAFSPVRIMGLGPSAIQETVTVTADAPVVVDLAGHAEIGWSPATGRNWTEYKVRLGSHGPRLTNMGINFFADPIVPWQ